jgi:hypothetical protein
LKQWLNTTIKQKLLSAFTPGFRAEYRKFVVLLRHFLLRLFQNDILKFENQRRESIILMMTFFSAAGCVISAAVLMPYLQALPGFTSETVWVEKTFFMTLCMAFTGIISVINWENMFLDEKDYLYISGLPIKTTTLFTAKLFSLLAFVGILSLALHVFPIFIFTFFLGEMINVNPFYHTSLLQFGVVHMLTSFMANLFVFLLVALIQSILRILLRGNTFKKISLAVQTLLLMGFVSIFTWFPQVASSLLELKEQYTPWFIYYFPPLWFVGLYEQLIGNYDFVFRLHFYIAPVAVTLLADLYILSIPVSFKRFSRPISAKRVKSRFSAALRSLKKKFDSAFLRHPIQKAIFYFTINALRRSRKHKLHLAVYIALPLAFAVTQLVLLSLSPGKGPGYLQEKSFLLIALPLLLYLFIILGLRVVVNHPLTVEANWVFRIAEGDYPTHYLRGLKKAVLMVGILPYFILFFLFYTVCWGVIPAFFHSVFCGVTAVVLMEGFFVNYKKMPFVSAYVPGKFRVKEFWPLYLLGFALYMGVFSMLGRFLLHYPVFYIFYYGGVVTDLYWLRRLRYKRNRGFCFVFDEDPEPAMLSLGFDDG